MPNIPSNEKINEWINLIYSQSCRGVIILNEATEILGFNEDILRIWECPKELLQPKDKPVCLSEIIKLEFPFTEYINELRNLGHIQIRKVKFSTFKGNSKIASILGWVMENDESGCITGWLWCDTTDFYVEMEKSLFNFLREMLNSIFRKAPILYFLWEIKPDYTTEILGVNELSEKEMQISANDVLGRDFINFAIPGPWRKPIMKYVKQMHDKPQPYLGNHPIFNNKGEEIYVRWLDVPVKPAEDRVWVVSIGENIQERTKLERRLRESEQRYKRMLEAVTDYVFHVKIYDGEVVETIHSPGCESITGYTPEDFKRDPYLWLNMVVEEDREKVINYANAIMRGEPQSPITHRIYRKDGQIRWIRNTSVLIFDENNKVIGYDGIIRDITAEVMAYEKLQRSEELYRNIVEQLVEGYLRIDISGRITFANRSAAEMLGLESSHTSGNLFDLVSDADRDKFISAISRIVNRETKSEVVECELPNKTNSPGEIVECSIIPITSVYEHIIGFSVLMRNITSRKRELERMLDIQKKESLANLVGGLAHDFNNLLMVMQGHIDLAFAEFYPNPIPQQILEHINGVQSAITKAGELCKQMLLYAGKGVFMSRKKIELNRFLREITPLLETTITRKIHLEMRLSESPLWVEGDELLLRQAVLGIVANSVEAIEPKSGRITISTNERFYTDDMLANFIADEPRPKSGRYVEMEVEDTGCGISANNLKHIFDPFFTTKFLGRGLGLSAIFGIVCRHKGAMKVESEEGKGTKVSIILPSVIKREEIEGTEEIIERKESILLVEDEQYLASVLTRVLNSRGYCVICKDSVDSALSVLRSEEVSRIKLIILDIGSIDQDLMEVFSKFDELRLKIPILLCSGSQIENIPKEYDKIILAKVRKPFVIGEIIEVVDQFWKTLS